VLLGGSSSSSISGAGTGSSRSCRLRRSSVGVVMQAIEDWECTPLAAARQPPKDAAVASSRWYNEAVAATRAKRILVVDDDQAIRGRWMDCTAADRHRAILARRHPARPHDASAQRRRLSRCSRRHQRHTRDRVDCHHRTSSNGSVRSRAQASPVHSFQALHAHPVGRFARSRSMSSCKGKRRQRPA